MSIYNKRSSRARHPKMISLFLFFSPFSRLFPKHHQNNTIDDKICIYFCVLCSVSNGIHKSLSYIMAVSICYRPRLLYIYIYISTSCYIYTYTYRSKCIYVTWFIYMIICYSGIVIVAEVAKTNGNQCCCSSFVNSRASLPSCHLNHNHMPNNVKYALCACVRAPVLVVVVVVYV